ncbi:LLM class flavin-dependent oxidoreductase [Saccharibacillus sp. JS10]|uniref:LLM class flavin-dependent oxidoreductase n=1 Tax=Saccharibacillus sp. JS10 TaxID=2950552 RepID=UPI00210B607B|nr:LLM class flavin-dependent oxidoreductase [Saccharibacillus sp. JS10]MCQ4085715.1 LLM class flavin-dependent oxidoreductase [Saccharibacillus sp. JS10]
MSVKLSILDQSLVFEGNMTEDTLRHTVELAKVADDLGYHRFWVSEHHDTNTVAGSSPEVLIAYLLAATKRIRVGSGGVMLQHYSPYKVAESFNVLANLEPDRVDLGIGRAPGGLPRSTLALRGGAAQEETSLTDKLEQLRKYLSGIEAGEGTSLEGLRAEPVPQKPAELYVLGASADSADLAATLGLPYVFSLFINGDLNQAEAALRRYRDRFVSVNGSKPQSILSLSAAVADTDEEAEGIAIEQDIFRTILDSGRKITIGNREKAEEFGKQSGEGYIIEHLPSPLVKGSVDTVGKYLLQAAQHTGVHELVVTSPIRDVAKRIHSFTLLKSYFDAKPQLISVPTAVSAEVV